MAEFFKKYKYVIIALAVAAAVLTLAFFAGGRSGDTPTGSTAAEFSSCASSEAIEVPLPSAAASDGESSLPSDAAAVSEFSDVPVQSAVPSALNETSVNSTAEDSSPAAQSPALQSAPSAANASRCTVSISCRTVAENMHLLPAEKAAIIPADGWILPPYSVSLDGGESAFDALYRACRENKIHMEFSSTPVYGSKYVEGIGNLYDFDCGSGSGWMYSVNGVFPSFGCSQYIINDGDTLQFVYTCNNGSDIGAEYAIG